MTGVPSRFQTLHVGLFLVALLGLPLAMVVARGPVLLLSGACFVLSGLMTIVGHRISMQGPLAAFLARAMHGPQRGTPYVIGGFWILLGVALVISAIVTLTTGDPGPTEAPVVPPPTA